MSGGIAPSLMPPTKAVATDKIISLFELFDEAFERVEIIAVIRVAHNHILATGRFDACLQCIAIPAFGNGHHANA